ncbi:Purine catabolism regulatory protein [Bacillus rhizoplanae]|uniref:Purine catabolism regulatory protein n=1 Tax=Bacillus rhizoplanae TaxID=2880966 RepID=A0ABM8YGA2_9BACI|nr:PucR family transcriptional regulator [Bacillus rhizoplanae]CAG9614740.1 Purine catabolism regulatory protein [Bacillus rhizoplanae]
MNTGVELSVQEILQHKHFQNAKVIAGEAGLFRTVKWLHVMEIPRIGSLLNGNELILSTGVGWKGDKEIFLSLLKEFIDSNAAGLCIELGKYILDVPKEIIELADRNNFPLIVFYHEVRFVDITQDVHTLLLKKHYQMISDLEDYSHQLNQLLLTSNSQSKILQLLHDYLQMTVLYRSKEGEIQIISEKTPDEQEKIIKLLREDNVQKDVTIFCQSIQALDQKFADLIVVSESEINGFESLIVDRSAIALAQNLLRELYVEERRKADETEWIQKWLDGAHSEERIHRYVSDFEPNLKINGCIVLLCKIDNYDQKSSDFTYLKILFRSIFEHQGFFLLTTVRKNQIMFILLNKRKTSDWKCRIEAGIEHLQKTELMEKHKVGQIQFGVGKFIDKLSHVKKSYHTAQESLIIQENMPKGHVSYFYDDLHIFRLVSIANEQGALDDFISDYLGAVLIYDQQNNGKLMETLKTYLKCNGSKQEAATNLYIVRQTLYQRLQKLNELLGEDFMDFHKRQAIEFAITAYDYVSASKSQ